MANNINQIKAAIEANLATIRDAYYAALNSDSSPEGVETARANYATALKSAQLNARTLVNAQTPLTEAEYTTRNLALELGISIDTINEDTRYDTRSAFVQEVSKQDCMDLFNKYISTIKKMRDLLTDDNIDKLVEIYYYIYGKDPGFPESVLLSFKLGSNPVNCWLACEMNEFVKANPNTPNGYGGIFRERRGGLFGGEDCWEYIRAPGQDLTVPIRNQENRNIPPLPWKIPSFPPELLPDWIPAPGDIDWSDPKKVGEWLEKMRKFLKEVQSNPSGNSPNPSCNQLYKEAVNWLADKVGIVLQFLSLGKDLQALYEEMQLGPCNGILRLDVVFRDREIGRFDDPLKFGEWLWKLHKKELQPMPNLDPLVSLLSETRIPSDTATLLNEWEKNCEKENPNRYKVALTEYEAWAAKSPEERNFVPPIKGLFPVLNTSDFTDEFAFMYLAAMSWYGLLKQESDTIYRVTYQNLTAYANECSAMLSLYNVPEVTVDLEEEQ